MANAEKEALCQQHTQLLSILTQYGANGAMLLPQLRELCLQWQLYPSKQSVNRVIRALKTADILTRQTWVDNSSDIILCKKYVYRFFQQKGSQEIATPSRPTTMGPYIQQSRRMDWLLRVAQKQQVTSKAQMDKLLLHSCNTMFLRLPQLSTYYERNARLLEAYRPRQYRAQLDRLLAENEQRKKIKQWQASIKYNPYATPAVTLHQMHRRGIYITQILPGKVVLSAFPSRNIAVDKLMNWIIDAYFWVQSLLPDYSIVVYLYSLDEAHKEFLRATLTKTTGDVSYWRNRLHVNHITRPEAVQIIVKSTDYITHWCGGIQRTDIF